MRRSCNVCKTWQFHHTLTGNKSRSRWQINRSTRKRSQVPGAILSTLMATWNENSKIRLWWLTVDTLIMPTSKWCRWKNNKIVASQTSVSDYHHKSMKLIANRFKRGTNHTILTWINLDKMLHHAKFLKKSMRKGNRNTCGNSAAQSFGKT